MKFGFKSKFNAAVLIIVVIIILIITYQGLNMDYKVEEGYIKIDWFTGVDISIKDITEIKVLDKAPDMTRITGVDLFCIRQGVYSVEGVGRVKMYASNIGKKLVLIKTDSIVYGLTPDNAEQFVRIINIK